MMNINNSEKEFTTEDFKILRTRWRNLIIGGAYDPSKEAIRNILTSINQEAKSYLEQMNVTPQCETTDGWYHGDFLQLGQNDYLWKDLLLGFRGGFMDGAFVYHSYLRLQKMSLAHELPGGTLYQDETLKKAIMQGLDYLQEHHVNCHVTTTKNNWTDWGLNWPQALTVTVMLMYDHIPKADRIRYIYPIRRVSCNNMIGPANALWQLQRDMYAAILLENELGNYRGEDKSGIEILNIVQAEVPAHIYMTESGDGFYEDGSFIGHYIVTGNGLVYNGGYGLGVLFDTANFVYMLAQTDWEVSPSVLSIFHKWISLSYEPIIYKGFLMEAFQGRNVGRADTRAAGLVAHDITTAILLAAQFSSKEEQAYLYALLKGWYQEKGSCYEFLTKDATYSIFLRTSIDSLLEDPTINPRFPAHKIYEFKRGDRVVAYQKGYVAVLAMTSNRTAHWETGSNHNLNNWNTGNGFLEILLDTDLRLAEKDDKRMPTIDLNRWPGTTAIYGHPLTSPSMPFEKAASVTLQPNYAACAMQLGADNLLYAKKAWFFFGEEIVALGTDIHSSVRDKSTETIFANSMTNELLYLNGNPISDLAECCYTGVQYANIGSEVGVVFPTPLSLHTLCEIRAGSWLSNTGDYSQNYPDGTKIYQERYVTLWQDHGAQPTDSQYSYILLPGKGIEETAFYVDSNDIVILENSAQRQVVLHRKRKVLGAIFWNSGTISLHQDEFQGKLSCNGPAVILIEITGKGVLQTVSRLSEETTIEAEYLPDYKMKGSENELCKRI